MAWVWKKESLLSLIALCVVTLAIFLPMNYAMVYSHPHNDFHDHIAFARELGEGGKIPEHIRAHPVWQISLLIVHRLSGVSFEAAAVLVQMALQLVLAILLYVAFHAWLPDKKPLLLAALSLTAMLVAQIMLLAFQDGLFYLGYIGSNTHHNPTVNMLKPFALMLFVYSVGLVQGRRFAWYHSVLAALLVGISTLVKPNFILCLLPAVGIFLLWRLVKKQPFDWLFTVLGLGLPAAAVLAWQFLATYGGGQPGILFAPLAVMRAFSGHLLVKFILSIWFPALVTLVYFRQAKDSPLLLLGWAVFAIGAAFTYLLAEGGERFMHGNWGWSGEIAMFILFVAAIAFFFQQMKSGKNSTWWCLFSFGFAPHIVAGVIYYIYTLSSGTFV